MYLTGWMNEGKEHDMRLLIIALLKLVKVVIFVSLFFFCTLDQHS
jgi:hypothetical protein